MYSKFLLPLFIVLFALNHCIAGENNNIKNNAPQDEPLMRSIVTLLELPQLVGLGMVIYDVGIALTEKGSLDKSVIVSIFNKVLKGTSLKSDEILFAQILRWSAISCGIIYGFIAAYEFNLSSLPCLCIGGVGAISGLIAGLPAAYLSRKQFNLPLV